MVSRSVASLEETVSQARRTAGPDSPSDRAVFWSWEGSTASTIWRRVMWSAGRERRYPPWAPRRESIIPARRRSLRI